MAFVAALGGLLLALALVLRELQLTRERSLQAAAEERLRVALEQTRAQLQHAVEDVYVLRTLLVERGLFEEGDIARARARLVEGPRRLAAEREALMRHLDGAATHLVLDEQNNKVH